MSHLTRADKGGITIECDGTTVTIDKVSRVLSLEEAMNGTG